MIETINYGTQTIEFEIQRAKSCKNTYISVERDVGVVVKTNSEISIEDIKVLVKSKAKWIIKKFEEIGYIPVVKTNDTIGGKGNERRYWLNITEYSQTQNEEDQKLDEDEISYERVDPSEIKLSWFYRFIFKNGEMKNKSIRGLFMLIVLFGGFISWAIYVCAFSLVLVREGQNFTTLDLLLIVCLIGFSYLSFKYWYIPLWNLPEHRVIKAPMTFISLNEDHADIEMYRDRERNQLTRITRFKGICPICSAEVVLRIGQPDHNLPLVGRCVESPFAHVYSFDRVLMSGKLLSR